MCTSPVFSCWATYLHGTVQKLFVYTERCHLSVSIYYCMLLYHAYDSYSDILYDMVKCELAGFIPCS